MQTSVSATSVVVSTYDEKRWDDLVACLDSLARQSLPPLEQIVVVDHNPALLEMAKREFPTAKVVANERPRGLAGARNTGIAAARGEIVAFIDDDARAEPRWLEELEGASPKRPPWAPGARCCHSGKDLSRPGSRPSSTGYSAAATPAFPSSWRPCAIRSAPTWR